MFKLYTNPYTTNPCRANHLKPAVDVIEDDKNFKLLINLPGISKENISLDLKNNVLSIKAENEKTDAKYIIRERNLCNFERSFELPENINSNDINANFTDGVLAISFPKKQIETIKIM